MPIISQDPLYQLLRDENMDAFNQAVAEGKTCNLVECDFRGLDLRGLIADGLNMSGAYFRGADLRGIDFRRCNLEGASFIDSKLSGCYFPKELAAEELRLSLEQGIRVRIKN